jgi:type I restriction enzyme S subunit
LVEQSRIVAEVERLLSLVEEAELLARVSVRRCARLRQSILKWAFEGRLADQDPSDEPASVLLERIRSETSSSRHSTTDADVGQPRRSKGRRHQLS